MMSSNEITEHTVTVGINDFYIIYLAAYEWLSANVINPKSRDVSSSLFRLKGALIGGPKGTYLALDELSSDILREMINDLNSKGVQMTNEEFELAQKVANILFDRRMENSSGPQNL